MSGKGESKLATGSPFKNATFREPDIVGLGASCDVVWGLRITYGLPTSQELSRITWEAVATERESKHLGSDLRGLESVGKQDVRAHIS